MGLTSRDMLKVGLMTMNNGVYKGKQVLSKSWIERKTAVHANNHPIKHFEEIIIPAFFQE